MDAFLAAIVGQFKHYRRNHAFVCHSVEIGKFSRGRFHRQFLLGLLWRCAFADIVLTYSLAVFHFLLFGKNMGAEQPVVDEQLEKVVDRLRVNPRCRGDSCNI